MTGGENNSILLLVGGGVLLSLLGFAFLKALFLKKSLLAGVGMRILKNRCRVFWRWCRQKILSGFGSAFAEFAITAIYALASIFIGVGMLYFQESDTLFSAISDNASQGEVMIAALAMMGPLAYSVVGNPPIRFKAFFQLVVVLYTIFGVLFYVLNKVVPAFDKDFMVWASLVALALALILNLVTNISNHRMRDPAEQMRIDTHQKAKDYSERAAQRGM